MRPLRSLLAVPANRPDLFHKAINAQPDGIMFDLEDSVPDAESRDASETLVMFLRGMDRAIGIWPSETKMTIRLRRPAQAAIFAPLFPENQRPIFVMPKIQDGYELTEAERACKGMPQFFPIIETPQALIRAQSIASYPTVAGLIFGAEDMSACLGRRSNDLLRETLSPAVLMAAKACGKQAIQTAVCVLDSEWAQEEYELFYAQGWDGAVTLTPDQSRAAQVAFSPSPEQDVQWARDVLAASGDGRPIKTKYGLICGAPTYRQARAILRAVEEDV